MAGPRTAGARRVPLPQKNPGDIWLPQSYLVTGSEEGDVSLVIDSEIDESLHELLVQISEVANPFFFFLADP